MEMSIEKAARNDITGDALVSKPTGRKFDNNFDGIDLVIFDEGGKDPIIKIITKQSFCRIYFEVSIPGRTDEWPAEIYDSSNLANHLKEFAEEGIIYSINQMAETFVIIYNSYRLRDDPTKPFVLTSSFYVTIYRVHNVPNMEICAEQRIGKEGFSLPGGLIASSDGKQILLLPFAEVLKKSKLKDQSYENSSPIARGRFPVP